MVVPHYKHLRYDIMYKMFKTYCMPLYGCPLWDYTGKGRLFNIPRTTHCVLVNEICDDIPVHEQLHNRFINFY